MKTTKIHYNLFKKECKYWIDRLKLDDWEVYFEHGGASDNAFATTRLRSVGGVATIQLTKDWDMTGCDDIEDGIKKTAKHEVIHILLGRFSSNANTRCVTTDDLDESEEALVRKLEKIIK